MDWDNNKKRYGMACFTSAKPLDPDGQGDGSQFFDDLEEARVWASKALKAGRFKFLALWDGQSGSQWEWLEDFSSEADSN